ncbi:hypothetical protein [Actinacidiphila sp. ITFR-21]|uniref:hypothetical protein n=1 Tax=Actinacidiphila sp. ITFR-21 TaxID=3075199 RepID=UPI00288B535C|nr:hypothetical protein [Streptomyces sp. ITFR-21]WNI16558.1 hypothetical protein RLT57_14255 [Streptomyces sp. ITFR-21]
MDLDESRSGSERDMNTFPDLPHVLRRSTELKEELVAFGESRVFERFFTPLLSEASGPDGMVDEATAISVIDHFLLQYRLPDGNTVADRFVARRTALTDRSRSRLCRSAGWPPHTHRPSTRYAGDF